MRNLIEALILAAAIAIGLTGTAGVSRSRGEVVAPGLPR